jgi:hypothetical protein
VKRQVLLWLSQIGWCLLKSPSQMVCIRLGVLGKGPLMGDDMAALCTAIKALRDTSFSLLL